MIESLPNVGETVIHVIPNKKIKGEEGIVFEKKSPSFLAVAFKVIFFFCSITSWLWRARSPALASYRWILWGLRVSSVLLVAIVISKWLFRRDFKCYIYQYYIPVEAEQKLKTILGDTLSFNELPEKTLTVDNSDKLEWTGHNFEFEVSRCILKINKQLPQLVIFVVLDSEDEQIETSLCYNLEGEHICGPKFKDEELKKLMKDGTAKDNNDIIWRILGRDGVHFTVTREQEKIWDKASGKNNFIQGLPNRDGIDHPSHQRLSHRIMKGVAKPFSNDPRRSTVTIKITSVSDPGVVNVLHFYPLGTGDAWIWFLNDTDSTTRQNISFLSDLLKGKVVELEGQQWKILPEEQS